MNTFHRHFILTAALATAALFAGCEKKSGGSAADQSVLRVGFFPNITHAQGAIGYNDTQTKGAEGFFEKAVGVKIEWYPFNAGPSAIEALFAGSIDVTYVGPNPPLNGYTRTKGADIRILACAARGGSALVVQPGSGLKAAADFRGKKIATPQLGNTQDVAARAWLIAGGLKIVTSGGDAHVIPTTNPDQLDLFKTKQLDAVWTVEPWVSRLELDAGAEVVLEQKEVVTTLIATSVKALDAKRELLKKFLAAHEDLTKKINAEPDWAKPLVSAAIQKATTKPLPAALLDRAWPRLKFSIELQIEDIAKIQRDAKTTGLLPEETDLGKFFAKP
jgi:NitT/TauT family transport system substrate-binding protein